MDYKDKQINILKSFVQDFADEGCAYGDDCPRFVNLNHYTCTPCQAKRLLIQVSDLEKEI